MPIKPFPLQMGLLGNHGGAMMAITDPSSQRPLAASPAAVGGRRPYPRCGSTYRSAKKAGRRVHCCPQRTRTPGLFGFFPANPALLWGHEWGHHPVHGPLLAVARSSAAELAAAVLADEGHAPVVAVLVPAEAEKKRQTSPSLPPKGENRGPLSGYSCKSGIFRVPQWSATTSVMAPPTTPSVFPRFGPEGRLTGGRRLCPRCVSTCRVCKLKARTGRCVPTRGRLSSSGGGVWRSMALPTGEAVHRYGELDPRRTAAALHLTC